MTVYVFRSIMIERSIASPPKQHAFLLSTGHRRDTSRSSINRVHLGAIDLRRLILTKKIILPFRAELFRRQNIRSGQSCAFNRGFPSGFNNHLCRKYLLKWSYDVRQTGSCLVSLYDGIERWSKSALRHGWASQV